MRGMCRTTYAELSSIRIARKGHEQDATPERHLARPTNDGTDRLSSLDEPKTTANGKLKSLMTESWYIISQLWLPIALLWLCVLLVLFVR
jgi:hypothetical protein